MMVRRVPRTLVRAQLRVSRATLILLRIEVIGLFAGIEITFIRAR